MYRDRLQRGLIDLSSRAERFPLIQPFTLETHGNTKEARRNRHKLADWGERAIQHFLNQLGRSTASIFIDRMYISLCNKIGYRGAKADLLTQFEKLARKQLYQELQIKTVSIWDEYHLDLVLLHIIRDNYDHNLPIIVLDKSLEHCACFYAGYVAVKGRDVTQVFNDSTVLTTVDEMIYCFTKMLVKAPVWDPEKLPPTLLIEWRAFRRIQYLCTTQDEVIFIEQSDVQFSLHDGYWAATTREDTYQAKHCTVVSSEILNTIKWHLTHGADAVP